MISRYCGSDLTPSLPWRQVLERSDRVLKSSVAKMMWRSSSGRPSKSPSEDRGHVGQLFETSLVLRFESSREQCADVDERVARLAFPVGSLELS